MTSILSPGARRLPGASRLLRWSFLLAGLTLLGVAGAGRARVEADPEKDYQPAAADGPWMVCVSSYTGETAAKMAHDLVLELRSRYDLPAFSFNRGAEERRKQQEDMDRRRQQQQAWLKKEGYQIDMPLRMRTVRIQDQYAVLIGGYPDMDAAHKALEKIKKLEEPKSVPLDSVGIAGPDADKKVGVQRGFVNPFRFSFVVRNPALPVEKPAQQQDPFLKKLNSGEKYSLLDCPKPWTLAVKEFYGAAAVQNSSAPGELLNKLFGRSALDASAMQAHEVARVLREMKFDAYVLHTRHGSIVAVGGYDSQNDPRLLQNQKMLANMQLGPTIQFFAMPLPMEVPRPE